MAGGGRGPQPEQCGCAMTTPYIPERGHWFTIGQDIYPGLAKLIEECGEIIQEAGKLIAYPDGQHPDGRGDIRDRLAGEIGDVLGCIDFFLSQNEQTISQRVVREHREVKRLRFEGWPR
jgi:NTP pyrophosphatase (non-canonical NTP hydrolase)